MTIERSIRSVLEQSFEDFELIVVVNGSTDRTQEIVDSIIDSRLTIVNSSPGIVPALNFGLKLSKGQFIARQDGDDFWYSNKLRNQIEFLKTNEQIDILGTQMLVSKVDTSTKVTNYPLDDQNCKHWLMNSMNPIGNPTVVFRRKVIDLIGGYWSFFPLAEDMDFFCRCIPHFKFSNLPTTEIVYNHVHKDYYDPNVPKLISKFYDEIYKNMKNMNY